MRTVRACLVDAQDMLPDDLYRTLTAAAEHGDLSALMFWRSEFPTD